jgi:hypothetical protein
MRGIPILLILRLLSAAAVPDADPRPGRHAGAAGLPSVVAVRVSRAPVIDGRLDDAP